MLDPRLLLDTAGWILGGVLVAVFASAGSGVGLLVVVAVVLLVAELTRNELRLARRSRQIATLSEMSSVGHRMSGPQPAIERVAEQIIAECRRLVPAQWAQLEVVEAQLLVRRACRVPVVKCLFVGVTNTTRIPDGEQERQVPENVFETTWVDQQPMRIPKSVG